MVDMTYKKKIIIKKARGRWESTEVYTWEENKISGGPLVNGKLVRHLNYITVLRGQGVCSTMRP